METLSPLVVTFIASFIFFLSFCVTLLFVQENLHKMVNLSLHIRTFPRFRGYRDNHVRKLSFTSNFHLSRDTHCTWWSSFIGKLIHKKLHLFCEYPIFCSH